MIVNVGDPLHLLFLVDRLEDLGFEHKLRMLRERRLLKLDCNKLRGLNVRAQKDGAKGPGTDLAANQILASNYHVFFQHRYFLMI